MRAVAVLAAVMAPAYLASAGCGSDGYIVSGRSQDPCIQSLPACPPRGIAGCTLSSSRYAERRFPGVFNFLVDARAGDEIEVLLAFAEQYDAGQQTLIIWNEPGCGDAETYDSQGADLFYEARDIGVLNRSAVVRQSGEHLIEIDSDMQAIVLVTVNVIGSENVAP